MNTDFRLSVPLAESEIDQIRKLARSSNQSDGKQAADLIRQSLLAIAKATAPAAPSLSLVHKSHMTAEARIRQAETERGAPLSSRARGKIRQEERFAGFEARRQQATEARARRQRERAASRERNRQFRAANPNRHAEMPAKQAAPPAPPEPIHSTMPTEPSATELQAQQEAGERARAKFLDQNPTLIRLEDVEIMAKYGQSSTYAILDSLATQNTQ